MVHIVKGFSIVIEAEVDIFLEFSCFVVSYAYNYFVISTCCLSFCEMPLLVSSSISCFEVCFGDFPGGPMAETVLPMQGPGFSFRSGNWIPCATTEIWHR